MKILINEQLSPHRYKTPEGYLICTDAILARTGKQTYRKNEIFADADDDSEIEVDRTADEVFSPATLASFENKPVTVEHPDEDVNVHNYKEYAVGFTRDIHRGKTELGEDVILGNLVITDEETIKEIEEGKHTELSCGYDCDITDRDHPSQKNIRGNHVALCEQGRAGIARIIDSKVKDNKSDAIRKIKMILNNPANTSEDSDGLIYLTQKAYQEISDIAHANNLTKQDMQQIDPILFGRGGYYSIADSIHDSVFTVGYVDRHTDKTEYVDVTANSREEAINKVKRTYRPYRVFMCEKLHDELTADANRLPAKLKREISQYLSRNSTFLPKSKKSWDIKDFVDEMERFFKADGIKLIRQSIKGWYKTNEGYLKKDYTFTINGYDDKFIFSILADDDYNNTEIISYFLDSAHDELTTDEDHEMDYIKTHKDAKEMFEELVNREDIEEDKAKRIVYKYFNKKIEDDLIESGSEEAFKKNIATEIRSGKDPTQAAAIAYSVKRANDAKRRLKTITKGDSMSKLYKITKVVNVVNAVKTHDAKLSNNVIKNIRNEDRWDADSVIDKLQRDRVISLQYKENAQKLFDILKQGGYKAEMYEHNPFGYRRGFPTQYVVRIN